MPGTKTGKGGGQYHNKKAKNKKIRKMKRAFNRRQIPQMPKNLEILLRFQKELLKQRRQI